MNEKVSETKENFRNTALRSRGRRVCGVATLPQFVPAKLLKIYRKSNNVASDFETLLLVSVS